MRKLTIEETGALWALNRKGSLCIGPLDTEEKIMVHGLMNSLVRKRRAAVEMTDDGPMFKPLTDA
jgi:hypothetical protein